MEFMYVKLTKEWGGFSVGDVVRFGWNKGESRVREGYGDQVEKQKAVNDPPKKRPEVETASVNPVSKPGTETAEVTPFINDERNEIIKQLKELGVSFGGNSKTKTLKKKLEKVLKS